MSEPKQNMTGLEIIAILDGINATLTVVNKLIAAGRERGEWTPDEEAAFDAKLSSLPAWWTVKPDAK